MGKEQVANSVGAFDDEGAFCLSSPLIFEESSNARGLRARYGRDGRRHARMRYQSAPVIDAYGRMPPLPLESVGREPSPA